MKTFCRLLITLLLAAMVASAFEPAAFAASGEDSMPASGEAETTPASSPEAEDTSISDGVWIEPGNTAANILNGGTMLNDGGNFYYSDGGIWEDTASGTVYLSSDDAKNLNLSGDWLYYTVGGSIRRIPKNGGNAETVYEYGTYIKQLYVMGTELRFVSGGAVYSYNMETGEISPLAGPAGVLGLIPTEYGNLYLAGEVRNYDLYCGTEKVLSGILNCYPDSGYLVVVNQSGTWQAELSSVFSGPVSLQEYTLHQTEKEAAANGLSDDEQLENEEEYLESDQYEALQGLVNSSADGYFCASNSNIANVASDMGLTADQQNIILRARQMAEVKWTPLTNRYSWGGDDSSYISNSSRNVTVVADDGTSTVGYFAAGKTYTGIPYSQPVNTGYVGWSLSITDFVKAVNNSSSAFYSGYSTYNRTAPYYGSDCAAFVSWAWDLPCRCTCTSLVPYSNLIGTDLSSLQVGDCLNYTKSHVILVTNLAYNSDGNIVSVEITEETPSKMRVTCYGELIPGKTYDYVGTLSSLQKNYLEGGYMIYRRNYSNSVSYTADPAVNLEGNGWISAPAISVSMSTDGHSAEVKLSHSDTSAIYYTLDGSTPTTGSTKYTGPIGITQNTSVRAIADPGNNYSGSFILTYDVVVNPFTDVSGSSWYAKEVEFVFRQGLFMGTTNTTFSPNANMTRGMFITVLGRLQGVSSSLENWTTTLGIADTDHINVRSGPSTSSSAITMITNAGTCVPVLGSVTGSDGALWYNISYNGRVGYVRSVLSGPGSEKLLIAYNGKFADLGSTYYTGYVQWAYIYGLVSGMTDTAFCPENSITRQDICVLIYNYLTAYKGRSLSAGTTQFSDDGNIADYAKTAVYAMKQIGVISGYTDGSFCPRNTATRAEVATIFMNLYNYLNG